MFAADIWAHLLEADPFSPEAGRRIRRELLETGGTVEPDVIMRRLLGLLAMARRLNADKRGKGGAWCVAAF